MDKADDIFDEMERLIDVTLTQKAYVNVSSGYWKPPTDIYETSEEIIVFVEIAGVKKSDISLTYRKGYLFISGIRKQLYPEPVTTLHQMEMDTGRFLRKIRISIAICEEEIEAEYNDGILKITLPKRR